MISRTHRFATGLAAAAAAMAFALSIGHAQSRPLPTCDPDNGGLTLPPGFCALVIANDNPTARHLVVAANGDVYVALRGGGQRGGAQVPGGVMALRDKDGDGRLETREHFGSGSVTGIALRNGYLYLAKFNTVEMRTSSDRSRKTARGSRPACVRCPPSRGTTKRSTLR